MEDSVPMDQIGQFTSTKEVSATPEIRRERILVERDGKQIEVVFDIQDFRDGNQKGQTNLFCTGFGLNADGSMRESEKLLADEAKKGKARFVSVGVSDIPPGYDKEYSDKTKPPSCEVDARVILEAMEKAGLSDVPQNPIAITGYSEGAVVGLSLAGEIQKRQKDMDPPPHNTLRMWSLTGVVPMGDKVTGLHVPAGFAGEVASITLSQIVNKWNEIRPQNMLPTTRLKNMLDVTMFVGQFGAALASREGRAKIHEKWKESQEGDLSKLNSVIQRVVSDPQAAINQFKKFEYRNPACDQLGSNWDVVISTPRQDSLYPWNQARKILKADNNSVVVEEPPVTLLDTKDGAAAPTTRELRWKNLFPNAGRVFFKPIGSRDFLDISRTHLGPENNTDMFIAAAPLNAKSEVPPPVALSQPQHI